MSEADYLKLLSRELVVALGCTEPTAIALTAATARQYVKGERIKKISVQASANIIKNAMAVRIPGAQGSGVNLAAALGAVINKRKLNLEIFAQLSPDAVEKAHEMIRRGMVNVTVADTSQKVYISVMVATEDSYAKAVMEDTHTHIALIEVDGKTVFSCASIKAEDKMADDDDIGALNINSIWEFANRVDLNKLELIKKCIALNRRIGMEGLRNSYGLKVGKSIIDQIERKMLTENLINYAVALTAAGSDVRMAGGQFEVMSNSGSGNQGIAATLPVVAVWEKLGLAEEKLLRATTLSHLITIYIKLKFGRLSALCGATIAAVGASCGVVFLLGGKMGEVEAAIQNVLGNVAGMLCDGAKSGCALKVSTCTAAAVQAALMAMEGLRIQATDGIIERDPEKTIDNLCVLGREGVAAADRIILAIMLAK